MTDTSDTATTRLVPSWWDEFISTVRETGVLAKGYNKVHVNYDTVKRAARKFGLQDELDEAAELGKRVALARKVSTVIDGVNNGLSVEAASKSAGWSTRNMFFNSLDRVPGARELYEKAQLDRGKGEFSLVSRYLVDCLEEEMQFVGDDEAYLVDLSLFLQIAKICDASYEDLTGVSLRNKILQIVGTRFRDRDDLPAPLRVEDVDEGQEEE